MNSLYKKIINVDLQLKIIIYFFIKYELTLFNKNVLNFFFLNATSYFKKFIKNQLYNLLEKNKFYFKYKSKYMSKINNYIKIV